MTEFPNQTLETIFKRRSIRLFEDRPVDEEKIRLILDAANQAPSAHNQQSWKFVVIRDAKKAELAQLVSRRAADFSKPSKSILRMAGRSIAGAPVVIAAMNTGTLIDHGIELFQIDFEVSADFFRTMEIQSSAAAVENLLLAATGQSSAHPVTDMNGPFFNALHDVMRELSHLVVKDGEGATKFVEVRISGANSDADAHLVGMAIANSPLVKTAIAGEDPNWGRVVMAIGKSGERADRDRISIRFGDILVAENGWVAPDYTEAAGAAYMKNDLPFE